MSYLFSNGIECERKWDIISRKRRLFVKICFIILLIIQLIEHLMGTIFYHKWSKGCLHGLRSCCLIYMILGWIFYPLFLSIFIPCDILFSYQISAIKNRDQSFQSSDLSQNNTCCCNEPEVGDCCKTCDQCCFHIPEVPFHTRYNNSCCCDGCCDCCIDCCVECCGESSRPLPPEITDRDIVYLGENHRVIYMPTVESIPMAEVVPSAIPPMEVNPIPNAVYS